MKNPIRNKSIFANIPFAALITLFGLVGRLHANGDPTTRLSAVERSANPAPHTITDIHVTREELRITPGIYTDVSVRYYLQNSSDKDYKDIDYAFPVDYQGTGEQWHNSPLTTDLYSESRDLYGWHDNYIREVSFHANDVSLPFEISPETIIHQPLEPLVQDAEEIETFGAWTEEEAAMVYNSQTVGRRWFYTRFSIGAGETMILDVRYSLRNEAIIGTYERIPRDWFSSSFYYDLSPAQHWGNGVARQLDIEIDCSGTTLIAKDDDVFRYYYPDSRMPIEFVRQGDKLVYRAVDFDFGKSSPLYFRYRNPSLPTLDDWLPCRIPNDRYTVTASAETPSYPIANLTDMDVHTAWAIPWKEGDSPFITLTFKEPVKIGAILFLGGYHKSEKTYTENCRPDGVQTDAKVLIADYEEVNEQIFYTGTFTPSTDGFYPTDIPVMDGYTEVTLDNLISHALCLQRNIFNNSLVTEVTIHIPRVIPGTKYNDLCVSEIIVLDENIYLSNRFGAGE